MPRLRIWLCTAFRTIQTVILLYKVELRACLNNRQQSHFWSFVESLFVFFLSSVTYLSPRWGLVHGALGISIHLQDLYRTRYSLA